MIRCPLCMAKVRAMVCDPGADWRVMAEADLIVAKATHHDRASLAAHMVDLHEWVPRGTNACREAA